MPNSKLEQVNISAREEFNSRVSVLFTQINNPDELYKMKEFGDWVSDSWEKLQEELTLQDLIIPSQEEGVKGLTPIWLLAKATVYFKSAAFLKVWDKFHESIKLEFFLQKAQGGKDKGKTGLWFLANATPSDSKPFLKVWEKFKIQLNFSAFLDLALEGNEKGQSVLWQLARADHSNIHTTKPSIFLEIFEKYQDEIKLSHLLNQALAGGWNGVNILCFLAMSAANNRVEAFQKVWHKFKTKMTLPDLLDKVIGVNCRNACALLNLEKAPISNLIEDVFAQLPGRLPTVYLERYKQFAFPFSPAIVPVVYRGSYERFLSLFEARNLFFSTLELIKAQALSGKTLSLVVEQADAAQAAGYVNAFYDLGKCLARESLFKEMAAAYKKLPATSFHFAQVNAELSEYYFGKLINVNFAQDGWEIVWRHYLAKALIYALQSGDTKNELIQKIAYMYIHQEKAISTEALNIIPEALLQSIPEKASAYIYFKLFEQVKETLLKATPPLIFSASLHAEEKRTLLPSVTEEPASAKASRYS